MEIVRWIFVNYGDWDCQRRSGEDDEIMKRWRSTRRMLGDDRKEKEK